MPIILCPRHSSLSRSLLCALLSVPSAGVLAQVPDATPAPTSLPLELSTVVITATRVPESIETLPIAIDRVDQAEITQGQMQINLSESLDTVPGMSVQNRQNYAQDLQVSVRGFGARSEFGVSGVRLYSDGIPGTMPDGQGQFSNFDLSSADRIEVLRGPFSALYGNSSGGVISVFTEDGQPGFELTGSAEAGSFDTQRYALKGAGDSGSVNYLVDATHFQTDGYRIHSEAERNILNSKVRFELEDGSKLTLVVNAIDTPFIQDPLGLTSAQFAADPTQAGVNALAYNTRKSLNQEQIGLIYQRELSDRDELQATLYSGHRATTQYQAIPAFTEASPVDPGGVIDLNRIYAGADLHLTDRRELLGGPLQTTLGVNYDDLQEARKGFLNFIGTELGVEGALRRDEVNRVYDFDEYLQLQWDPTARWRAMAGLRNNVVDVSSHDLLAVLNGSPDSGVRYSAATPVAGVIFQAASKLHLYGSYGQGFDTPTLDNLAYRSTNGSLPGLNLGLKAARSDDYEVGLKAGDQSLRADVAAFYIRTHDELAVEADAAGRSVYENIGESQRKGMEAGLDTAWTGGFSARVAYTYINAVTEQAYTSCIGSPCLPVIIPAGNHLPAVPEDALYAGLTWRYVPRGFSVTLEAISRAQIFADDRNSEAAAGYTVANLRFGLEQKSSSWHFSEFARIDNLTNRSYVGSVIVNETNSRFFEPEPGRTFDLMFTASHRD